MEERIAPPFQPVKTRRWLSGPGHVELTPNAGERGVAVFAAYRDTHFRLLRDVAIGDEIDVTRGDGKTFRYRADEAPSYGSIIPGSIR